MNIAFVDLKRQNKHHLREFTKIVHQTLRDAIFVGGKPVEQFEKKFARLCKRTYCVSLNSGTDALWFALMAYGIGPGDEVITVPNTYFSTVQGISNIGATPVFVDVDPVSFTLDVSRVKQAITKKTRAIIPVHLFGQSADMDPIVQLAKQYKLHIIEDCCQAHGAEYKSRVLPYTDTGAFSFYPGKNLGAFGDGGALVTDNKRIRDTVLRLRNDGSTIKYVHTVLGYKSRLDTMQAAILSAKLPYLKSWNEARRRKANLYYRLLRDIPQVRTPKEMPYAKHVYHIYCIEVQKRDALQQYLSQQGIKTVIHYPTPVHLQAAYAKEGYKKGDFPVTEEKAKSILSIPMFPELRESEVRYICNTIKKFYSSHKRR